MNALKSRGIGGILIAVVDGLKGFPDSKLRRAVRTRGHFPNDDAATKLLYLSLNRAAAEWKRLPRECSEAKTQFAIMFNERFVNA